MKAIAVSPGYAFGKVYLLKNEIDLSSVPERANDESTELARFQAALEESAQELKDLIAKARTATHNDQADIFEAHALMIEDPAVVDETTELIKTKQMSAAWAYKKTTQNYAQMLAGLDDDYLKERAADVRDIADRVLGHLLGQTRETLKQLPLGSVLVAYDVTPSQISALDLTQVGVNVMGIITEIGGKNSHTAILARALEVPMVAGARRIIELVKMGTEIMFDAFSGEIIIEPSQGQLGELNKKISNLDAKKKELESFKGQSSETTDHHPIQLAANIGNLSDIPSLLKNDAEAVGLYRTEFVFLDQQRIPTQQEQFNIYREVFQKLNGKNCIIRTLDIGGDKQLAGLSIDHEANPFLGLRGVRLCLAELDLFKEQLKAILRAGAGHKIGIMIPMVSNIEEILQTKTVLAECQQELKKAGENFSSDYQFGVMIEVPSAAMIVDLIARHVDFISIGTNDLTQYVCAADRMNDKVEKTYDPYNPGFLRTMNLILDTARKHKLHAGICGSLAHADLLIPLFIGMGVTELSMTSQHVLQTRKLVRSLNYIDCQKLVAEVLQLETSAEIRRRLEQGIR